MRHNDGLVARPGLFRRILTYLDESPVVILLGARQTGKTTLAGMVTDSVKEEIHVFDLERAASRAALANPEITLDPLRGLVVIDEIQRMPALFETLRPLADRPGQPARFLLLGSASSSLVRGVSESLAGRCLFLQIPGFSIEEMGADSQRALWLRGGFPRSLLASSLTASQRWRETFITIFLERDVPRLGFRVSNEALRRYWMMTAHYHGQVWNASELARSLGCSPKTALLYRDILEGGYVVRVLQPWFANLKKRQIKSPKVYVRDSGLLHTLLGITTMENLFSHPRYGASWEGFALEQILTVLGFDNAYFWKTQRGAELDLLLFRGSKRWGFEFKCSDAPTLTKSMRIALSDLSLERLFVVYPGKERYLLHKKVEVIPMAECVTLRSTVGGTL